MQLFYTQQIEGDLAYLGEEEARHCTQVLRKKAGDTLYMVDGQGGWYETILTDARKKTCTLEIKHKTSDFGLKPYHLHIAIAPTKNINRFEWFLEKATEIGIDEITPIICKHSERNKIRLDRLQKVVLSAMKQSLKAYLPKINELTKFDQFMKNLPTYEQGYIAHCEAIPKPLLNQNLPAGQKSLILIGPEGDFNSPEIELAKANNFVPVSLGKSRLRTETAGIVAAHTVALKNE